MNKKTEPRRFVFTVDELNRLHGINRQLLEAIPDPERLELLASWIDHKYPNDSDPEIQKDLRNWATLGRAAIAAAEGEASDG